jgi:hypothetical protein
LPEELDVNDVKRFGVLAATLLLAAAWWPGPIAALAGPGPLVATASMGTQRSGHSATLLTDGSVLVAGGAYCVYILDGGGCDVGISLASAEIYHPDTGTWSAAGSMAIGRFGQSATRLSNGTVLVAGGFYEPFPGSTDTPAYLADAELYDPATGSWSTTGSLNQPRSDALATLLGDGTVLVAGGSAGNSAELYHPDTGTWSATGSMAQGHEYGTITRLPNGKVLVVGGIPAANTIAASELYDPASATWAVTGAMVTPRSYHSATLLKDGTVLVAGGLDALGAALNVAEIFQPSSGTWSVTTSTANNHAFQHPNAVLLPDGTVLLTDEGAEVYDPVARSWTFAPDTTAWYGQSATLLNDGRVLIAGGCCVPTTYLALAQLYSAPGTSPDPPLTATGQTLVATEGGQLSGVVAAFSDADPSATLAQYSANIAWGDGSASPGSISAGVSGFTVSGTHTYAEEGTPVVTVAIFDSGGAAITVSSPVAVADAALTASGTSTALSARVKIATTLTLGSLTDSDPGGVAGDYAVTIAWGDGSASAGIITAAASGRFTTAGTHAYRTNGKFTINVAARDFGGYAAAPVSVPIMVSN